LQTGERARNHFEAKRLKKSNPLKALERRLLSPVGLLKPKP